jgi:hypothetical protein
VVEIQEEEVCFLEFCGVHQEKVVLETFLFLVSGCEEVVQGLSS